jgi:DNA-binding MarR family transcriptional regulator
MDAVRRHAEWVEARHGLSASELWALWELEQTPGLRAVDLAKAMAVHRTTAEALLHALETRGLAQHTAREDEHASGHYLTEAGKHLAQATPDHGPGILKTALEQLPEATLNQLVDSLKPMVENMPFREDRAALKPMADLLHLAASRGKA